MAIVVGHAGIKCRLIGSTLPVEVIEVGSHLAIQTEHADDRHATAEPVFDRQLRAFGVDGQHAIRRLKIAIVGLGGTGSVVAQQLGYLGASDLILVDPDQVEGHNLNRLVGATRTDIGQAKVAIAERQLRLLNPNVRALGLQRDVVHSDVADQLVAADIVFCCTDSHASRAVLNQIAYQYFIPCIDMGVGIALAEQAIISITGRVQMLAPGLPCLTCTNMIDARRVREEMMTPEQRQADPYFTSGHGEPQPAVITLNSIVASLATTMFLGIVTRAPFKARFQIYDGLAGVVRNVASASEPRCIVCSPYGALGRGPSWPLPTRPGDPRVTPAT
jgi:molybdopterin-synthase adenylyltransferase